MHGQSVQPDMCGVQGTERYPGQNQGQPHWLWKLDLWETPTPHHCTLQTETNTSLINLMMLPLLVCLWSSLSFSAASSLLCFSSCLRSLASFLCFWVSFTGFETLWLYTYIYFKMGAWMNFNIMVHYLRIHCCQTILLYSILQHSCWRRTPHTHVQLSVSSNLSFPLPEKRKYLYVKIRWGKWMLLSCKSVLKRYLRGHNSLFFRCNIDRHFYHHVRLFYFRVVSVPSN